MTHHFGARVVGACSTLGMLHGCAGSTTEPTAPQARTNTTVVIAAPTAPPPPLPPGGDGGAVADPAPGTAVAKPERRLRVTVEPQAYELTGAATTAPCDLSRLYRGGVGDPGDGDFAKGAPLSLLVQRSTAGAVQGSVRYDRGAAPLSVTGQAAGSVGFTLVEDGGGTFAGRCNPDTGELTGTYTLRGKSTPFTLYPRPATWPGLYALTRSRKVSTCEVEDQGIRHFGGSAPLEGMINFALDSGLFVQHVREMGTCAEESRQYSSTRVLFAGDDVLTVQDSISLDFGGAHPMNGEGGGRSIDLRTGRTVRLSDLVTDVGRLRALMPGCARDYLATEDQEESGDTSVLVDAADVKCGDYPYDTLLWDCDPSQPATGPSWALVEGGIAILAVGHPHVMNVMNGKGPILSWAALKREGLLPASSPVARLWKGVTPAAADAPACDAGFRVSEIVRWSVLSP